MPDTLLSSLSSTLNLSTREEIARSLGESEQAVSKGLEFATAALFGGLHRQTGQSDVMRQVVELASKAPTDLGSALNASQLGNPNSQRQTWEALCPVSWSTARCSTFQSTASRVDCSHSFRIGRKNRIERHGLISTAYFSPLARRHCNPNRWNNSTTSRPS